MKKKIILIILSLVVVCSNITVALEKENDTLIKLKDGIISSDIPIGEINIEKTINGDEISIDDFGRLLVLGKPNLPSKIFSIAIPPQAKFIDLSYELYEPVVLTDCYIINPVPIPKITDEKNQELKNKQQKILDDNFQKTYENDDDYPVSIVEFERISGFRKYNLVDIRVNPISYKPLSGKITYYPKITVHVKYEFLEDYNPSLNMFDDEETFERRASDFILNYQQAKDWYETGKSDKDSYDYVIITLDSLTSHINDLVDWEEEKGRSVNVVTTSWIESNYAGYDLAEKMRNFLREKYPTEEWGIQDLCIIGHWDDIPMRETWQNVGGGNPETDFYYAELSLPDNQSWDIDGDHQYGETSDPIDFYGEINVGRIPWSNPDTVEHICQKSVSFEQNNDPAFKNNILLLAEFLDDNTDAATFMEYLANSTIHPWMDYWMKTRMYELFSSYDKDYIITHQNVVNVWSSGKFAFVSWNAHGSPNGCSFINVNDCTLLNDDYPSIISAAACSNSDTDYLNIGQAMMRQGAIGFLGANKVAYYSSGWNDPSDGSDQSFKYFFKSSVTSKDYTQGHATQFAISEMYENGLWINLRYETFIHSSLWGNPDLGMRSIYENDPPEKPMTPDGPLEGKIRVEYTYSTTTTDPNTENIYYLFDWDDGTNSGWIGPYQSGETVEAKHTWTKQDTYDIKVIAQDINGTISDWSDHLSIQMPLNDQITNIPIFNIIKNFFENHQNIFPILRIFLQI